MKVFIVTALLLFGYCAKAQEKKKADATSFDIYYGYRPYFQKFYNQLNTVRDQSFNKPLQVIGMGASGNLTVDREGHFLGHIIYNQVIPQAIRINDTIQSKISGFMMSFALGGALSTKSGILNLYIYGGVNGGRLRIYGNSLTRQKNVFFSPKIGIQPKIKLGKVTISCIIEADYDITNPNWKRTLFSPKGQTDITKIRQSGITAQLGVGFVFD